jgi:hypothetical protein
MQIYVYAKVRRRGFKWEKNSRANKMNQIIYMYMCIICEYITYVYIYMYVPYVYIYIYNRRGGGFTWKKTLDYAIEMNSESKI